MQTNPFVTAARNLCAAALLAALPALVSGEEGAPEGLIAEGGSCAGTVVDQGQASACFLRFSLRVDRGATAVTRVWVEKRGTLDEDQVRAVRLYADTNASGTLDPGDALLAAGPFDGGDVALAIPPRWIGTSPSVFFLACDLAGEALPGATLGLHLAFADCTAERISIEGLPLESGLSVVRDVRRPSAPVVSDEGDYTVSADRLEVQWQSSVVEGEIVDSEYAVGTTTGTPDVRGWTSNGAARTVSVRGLSLESGRTYYVLVRSRSNYGLWSGTGASDGITVDRGAPKLLGAPSAVAGPLSYTVSWQAAKGGISGVEEYELQEREEASPWWGSAAVVYPSDEERAQASARRAPAVTNHHVFSDHAPGTYYYRIRAKNAAGTWSDFSEPLRVVVVGDGAPETISRAMSCPNPFDSRVEKADIRYVLNHDTGVTLTIYDLFGRRVRRWSFAAGQQGGRAGDNAVLWDGTDEDGGRVGAGGYLAVIAADSRGVNGTVTVKIAVRH